MTNEVVVSASRKRLQWIAEDASGVAISLVGVPSGQWPYLQATSNDIAKTLNVQGVIVDAPNGVVEWQIGTVITSGDMGTAQKATFTCKVKWWDPSGEFDWSDSFELNFVMPPSVT